MSLLLAAECDVPMQYKIIIRNMAAQAANFYAFQQQAAFSSSASGTVVYSTCLSTGELAPSDQSGAQLDFAFDAQIYAGAQCRNAMTGSAALSHSFLGNTSSLSMAFRAVALTTSMASDNSTNFVKLSVNPLGLSAPFHQEGLAAGFFGLQVPTFAPGSVQGLQCGCAVINQDESITLSSFVAPPPATNLYFAPMETYYVKIGSFSVGQVVNYDTANSARCDFSNGASVIAVSYGSDGTFTTAEVG